MIQLKAEESRSVISFISVINDLKINGIFLAASAVTEIPEQPSQYLVEGRGIISTMTPWAACPEPGSSGSSDWLCQMIYFQTIRMIRNTSYQGRPGHSPLRPVTNTNQISSISINIDIFFLLFLLHRYYSVGKGGFNWKNKMWRYLFFPSLHLDTQPPSHYPEAW